MEKGQIVKRIKRILCRHIWEYSDKGLRSCPRCGLVQEGIPYEEYFSVGMFVYRFSNMRWRRI